MVNIIGRPSFNYGEDDEDNEDDFCDPDSVYYEDCLDDHGLLDNFDPNEMRDDRGRWSTGSDANLPVAQASDTTSGVLAVKPVKEVAPYTLHYNSEIHDLKDRVQDAFHHSLDDALHASEPPISKEQADAYRRTIDDATQYMPQQALQTLIKGVRLVYWHPNVDSVAGELDRRKGYSPGSSNGVLAFYNALRRDININGGRKDLEADQGDLPDYSGTGIYAHELTHALDKYTGQHDLNHYDPSAALSNSESWADAYRNEILGFGYPTDDVRNTPTRLSNYAKSSQEEAFAEFGRLLYNTRVPLGTVEHKFPECSAFFKYNGLWPTRRDSMDTLFPAHNSEQLLPDLFNIGGTIEGNHWDGWNPKATTNYSPNEVRDEHGRWTGGGANPAHIAHDLQGLHKRLMEPDSGFTYSLVKGTEPSKGYVVSTYPERSQGFDETTIKPVDLVRYAKKNRDLLSDPENNLGGWHDPKTHRIYLDVSKVVQNEDRARQLALQHDQIAYFDIGNLKSVDVNRAAKSGGATHNAGQHSGRTASAAGPAHDLRGLDGHVREDDRPAANRSGASGSTGRVGPRRLVANASEDQEVSLVENFLRSPIWGQHLSQAYLRGLSKGFDDVRAGERSQITDNFNHAAYAGAKEQFLDDIVRNTAPFSLRRIWNSYRPHIAANLPSQAAVLTLGRMAVLNAYTAGQLDAYQRLGVQLVNLRKNTSCNVTSGPVAIRNALNRLPHNPSCRCVWQPLRNQQPKKQRMLPASPLHTFSALLSGDLQVNATTSPLVWLVRHGETALNSSDHSKDRIRGWKDVPLNDDGLVEAKKLGEFFKDKPVAFLVASDLQRCRQTALTIAQEHNIKPMFTLALRPWNVGDYTGDLSSKVAPVLKKFAVQTPDKQIPNGESFNQFKARVLTYVELLLNQARDPKYNPTVIVSHFRVLKVVQAWIAAGMKGSGVRAVLDFDVFFQFKDLSTGGIFKLTEPNGDKWKLQIQTR